VLYAGAADALHLHILGVMVQLTMVGLLYHLVHAEIMKSKTGCTLQQALILVALQTWLLSPIQMLQ
jgi:hypothetical protein